MSTEPMHTGLICLGLWSKTKNTFTSVYTLGNVGHNLNVHKWCISVSKCVSYYACTSWADGIKSLLAFDVQQKILSVLTPFHNHVPYVLLCPGNLFLFWPRLHSLFITWLIFNCVRKERERVYIQNDANKQNYKQTYRHTQTEPVKFHCKCFILPKWLVECTWLIYTQNEKSCRFQYWTIETTTWTINT